MVNRHNDLLIDGDQCIGGGYYSFDYVQNRIVLDGRSYDFGKPRWHLLDSLIIPAAYEGLAIIYRYNDDPSDDFHVSEQFTITYYD